MPPSPLEDAAIHLGGALEQSRAVLDTTLRNWAEEGRSFFEDMARDGAEAARQLQRCKSPLEVVAVEQAWFAARTKSYLDAGARFLCAAVSQAESAAAKSDAFHLPD